MSVRARYQHIWYLVLNVIDSPKLRRGMFEIFLSWKAILNDLVFFLAKENVPELKGYLIWSGNRCIIRSKGLSMRQLNWLVSNHFQIKTQISTIIFFKWKILLFNAHRTKNHKLCLADVSYKEKRVTAQFWIHYFCWHINNCTCIL